MDFQFWDEHVERKRRHPQSTTDGMPRCRATLSLSHGWWHGSSTDELNIAVTQLWRRKICVLRLLETDAIMLADVVIEEYQTGTTSLRNLPRR
jgi:hypothetical protein